MLRFENVSFGHGDRTILKNLSFAIAPGEFVAVIGANGAGKSTLTKLSNGLYRPAAGRVLVHGQDTRSVRVSRLARETGYLFQNPDLQLCQPTVREEILLGLAYTQEDPEKRLSRCEKVLADLELEGSGSPMRMSRGERQRVALASVLAREPGLLILDVNCRIA